MGESIGRIIFINSHEYVSDVAGTQVTGCMATMKTDDGRNVVLYTQSLRLQSTMEMAYATKHKVTVDYFEAEAPLTEQRLVTSAATDSEQTLSFEGPFNLKAIWTLE